MTTRIVNPNGRPGVPAWNTINVGEAAALGGVLLYVAVRIFDVRTFAAILKRTRAEFALAAAATPALAQVPVAGFEVLRIVTTVGEGPP